MPRQRLDCATTSSAARQCSAWLSPSSATVARARSGGDAEVARVDEAVAACTGRTGRSASAAPRDGVGVTTFASAGFEHGCAGSRAAAPKQSGTSSRRARASTSPIRSSAPSQVETTDHLKRPNGRPASTGVNAAVKRLPVERLGRGDAGRLAGRLERDAAQDRRAGRRWRRRTARSSSCRGEASGTSARGPRWSSARGLNAPRVVIVQLQLGAVLAERRGREVQRPGLRGHRDSWTAGGGFQGGGRSLEHGSRQPTSTGFRHRAVPR